MEKMAQIPWNALFLAFFLCILLISNLQLTITIFPTIENKKEKMKMAMRYFVISIVEFLLFLGTWLVLYKTKLFVVVDFIDDALTRAFNIVPLWIIVLWLGVPSIAMYIYYITKGWLHYSSKKAEFLDYNKIENTKKAKKPKRKELPLEDVTIENLRDYRAILKQETGFISFLFAGKLFAVVFDDKGYKKFSKYRPNEDKPNQYPSVYYGTEKHLSLCTKNESIMHVRKLMKGEE